MKRKLFTTLLALFLGGEVLPSIGYQPQLFDRVVQWWNAPPAPPSPEAQRLIDSLESGEGWQADKEFNAWGPDFSVVKKNNTTVVLHAWHADVKVGGARASGSFTFAELREVNDAAEKCLRRLTAQALEMK